MVSQMSAYKHVYVCDSVCIYICVYLWVGACVCEWLFEWLFVGGYVVELLCVSVYTFL